MSSIKLKHSGGNGVIISAPDTNPASDKTIKLPSNETGEFATKDSANSLQNVTGINGGQLGNRNIIINGGMQVAQRGTSSTDQNYGSLDRFKIIYSGTDEAPTHSQVDVAAGQTPYTLGFRKAYRITNGNQTSGAQSNSRIELQTNLEGQDLAQSGWNFVSSSSNITLSFWIKSSVAQTFASRLQTQTAGGNGATSRFKFNFALNADTWTKVTKTISGNANLAFATDNQNGFRISFFAFMGTTFTDSSTATDVWADNTGGDRADDMTTTWFTTNDSTLEITGVQLEVGSVATDFEFRSFAQELALCQRYFYAMCDGGKAICENATMYNSSSPFWSVPFPVEMRAQPSLEVSNSSGHFIKYENNGGTNFDTFQRDGITSTKIGSMNGTVSGTAGRSVMIRGNNASSKVHWSAEL